jgi:GNAT superfamily N-acetyltransferase
MAHIRRGDGSRGDEGAPRIAVHGAVLDDIRDFRNEYRWELDVQIVHDSWHERGFTDLYRLILDGDVVGYGAIGGAPGEPRTVLKEIWTIPERRRALPELARALIAAGGAESIEAQTNDTLLYPLVALLARETTSDTLLFADGAGPPVEPPAPGVAVRALTDAERAAAFPHTTEPVGTHGLLLDGRVVATGGWLTHYNPPYADLYMEVDAAHRRRGFASAVLQAVKRAARDEGYVPAARCREENVASRRALETSGMVVCGRIVRGRLNDRAFQREIPTRE